MLKPCFILLFLLVITLTANAQTHKGYITDDGSRTPDPSKAVSYILYQKMEGDSAWSTRQYDMNDTIMTIGTFKDEQFTIPHGKFIYYKLLKPINPVQYKYNYVTHKTDTIKWVPKNYVISKGYYLNGGKEGKWLEYTEKGVLYRVSNFQNNKLNGTYQEYYPLSGGLFEEGNYVNGTKDGIWYSFGFYGDTSSMVNYKNGVAGKWIFNKNKKEEFTDGKPQYDIIQYLSLELANTKFSKIGTFNGLYHFVLTKEGKLVQPSVSTSVDLEIDSAIIDKLLAAPNWEPAYYNKKLVNFPVSINLEIITSKKKPVQISYPLHTRYTRF
jgi:antitoxin component YwqK of YwqJK toxin-antitoxin module